MRVQIEVKAHNNLRGTHFSCEEQQVSVWVVVRDQCCWGNIGGDDGKGVGEVRGHINRNCSTTCSDHEEGERERGREGEMNGVEGRRRGGEREGEKKWCGRKEKGGGREGEWKGENSI